MSFFENFYRALIYIGDSLQSLFLLAVRLFWGYQFFETGKGKLSHISDIAHYFASLNIPWPTFSAYLAGTTECIGGLCLILGLASRFVSIPLMITMTTALLTADWDSVKNLFDNPSTLLSAAPFTFLMAALIIFIFGPGYFSIDRLLEKYFGYKK